MIEKSSYDMVGEIAYRAKRDGDVLQYALAVSGSKMDVVTDTLVENLTFGRPIGVAIDGGFPSGSLDRLPALQLSRGQCLWRPARFPLPVFY
jgi:hypothetical protein